MGVYRSGRTRRIRISRFGMRPSSFKEARTKKPLKKSKNSLKMPVFESFLVLATLRLDGRIPNLENQILWVLPGQ